MFPTGFKPLLASEADLAKLKYPVWVSGKLDGIRCFISDGVAYSRTLKPLPNLHIQKYFADGAHDGLDGEILVGDILAKDVMQATQSGVMRVEGEPEFTFLVFDDYSMHSLAFEQRYEAVIKHVYNVCVMRDNTRFVKQQIAKNVEELMLLEEWYVEEGYEGVMLRDPNAKYKFGRASANSQELLKVKRFFDSEAKIVGAYPRMHNANEAEKDAFGRTKRSSKKEGKVALDTLGGFNCVDIYTNEPFDLSGFTADVTKDLWEKWNKGELDGWYAKYKYQKAGMTSKPRFHTFQGLRHPDDIS